MYATQWTSRSRVCNDTVDQICHLNSLKTRSKWESYTRNYFSRSFSSSSWGKHLQLSSQVFFFVFSVSLCRGNPVRGDRIKKTNMVVTRTKATIRSEDKTSDNQQQKQDNGVLMWKESIEIPFEDLMGWVQKKDEERKQSVVHERGTFSVIIHWITKCSSFLWSVSPWQNWHGFFLHWALGTLPWYKTSFEPNSCGQQDWYNI